uniref:Ubiquitin-like protease family profile domain-containing protein n=1 Tax=Amphimedon queenslandica TaxID=400682 RepID=A0A1X7TP91_AMPQE
MTTTESVYILIDDYKFTLTVGYIENLVQDKELGFKSALLSLTNEFKVTPECMNYIASACEKSTSTSLMPSQASTSGSASNPMIIDGDPKSNETQNVWVTIEKLLLKVKDKLDIANERRITDVHISAAQFLLKASFPHLNGLQSTCYQLTRHLHNVKNLIQVLHVSNNHWAVVSSIPSENDSECCLNYYDSVYSKLPENSERILSFLLAENGFIQVKVNCVPVKKQSGSSDCGLYAIANATALANGIDPQSCVYRQNEMRQHLIQCISNKKMTLFPISQTKHHITTSFFQIVIYYCPCKREDDGRKMVQCEVLQLVS